MTKIICRCGHKEKQHYFSMGYTLCLWHTKKQNINNIIYDSSLKNKRGFCPCTNFDSIKKIKNKHNFLKFFK